MFERIGRSMQCRAFALPAILVVIFFAAGYTAHAQPPVQATTRAADVEASALASTRVFAFNDLGMHCYDADFSVFATLPLFNVLHAQVIRVGALPELLGDDQVRATYKAMMDPGGSINTTSRGKTNFWRHVKALFGVTLPVDVGLEGAKMPGAKNAAKPFTSFDSSMNWFAAPGIPITVWNDSVPAQRNPYSLMRVSAIDKATGKSLGFLPTVIPASDEMDCGTCHLTGQVAAVKGGIPWSANPNLQRQYKQNILLLHDADRGTTLHSQQPVLCASCHYSKALDLGGVGPAGGQLGKPYFSRAVHGFHASRIVQDNKTTKTCFSCHPGKNTQCLRGAMAEEGIVCAACHGNMSSLARLSREPWADEPKCQSCHTGDAVSHKGTAQVFRVAYDGKPGNAVPRVATNKRFAEEDGKLYRNSLGHHGVACESCHGSPHAEWPSMEANDNLAAVELQGHSGPIIECRVCHGNSQLAVDGGPHGLHNINAAVWYDGGHEDFYESNKAKCQACHGINLNGSMLSQAPVSRTFKVEGRTVKVAAGQPIGCTLCHEKPGSAD